MGFLPIRLSHLNFQGDFILVSFWYAVLASKDSDFH